MKSVIFEKGTPFGARGMRSPAPEGVLLCDDFYFF